MRPSRAWAVCFPASALVEMSREEMVVLARVVGATSNTERDEAHPRWGDVGSGIYDALVGSVFNAYWDGGVNEAWRTA